MFRHSIALLLSGLILLTQVGLPVHLHYCKGILESASIFFKAACEEHKVIEEMPVCCQLKAEQHCTPNGDGCCDDETKVITQTITSVAPSLSLELNATLPFEIVLPSFSIVTISKPVPVYSPATPIHGPPAFILHKSLILYA